MTYALVLTLLKKKKWYGRLMVNIFTFTSTNGINYTICFLLVSQDYSYLYYQVYDGDFNGNDD